MIRRAIFIILLVLLIATGTKENKTAESTSGVTARSFWNFQSVDTMKYSRDIAREKLNDTEYAVEIDRQVKAIADLGATHVAIATPYDEEFIPYLSRWVTAARKNNLKVWFRGNFSGWESWFGYPKMNRDEHMTKLKAFLENHQDLFVNGDIFTPCPECENGGPGDPRMTRDIDGFRRFLVQEHDLSQTIFKKFNKTVESGFASMNGDVARLIMDPDTTKKLGGYVTVDHYVKTPRQLNDDVTAYAKQSGGKVILGEWGAPIPDIHGKFSEQEQAAWISEALELLAKNPDLVGVNYWTHIGSSTELWNPDLKPRPATSSLHEYFSSTQVSGTIVDNKQSPIADARVTFGTDSVSSNTDGSFSFRLPKNENIYTVSKSGFETLTVNYDSQKTPIALKLDSNPTGLIQQFVQWLKMLFGKL